MKADVAETQLFIIIKPYCYSNYCTRSKGKLTLDNLSTRLFLRCKYMIYLLYFFVQIVHKLAFRNKIGVLETLLQITNTPSSETQKYLEFTNWLLICSIWEPLFSRILFVLAGSFETTCNIKKKDIRLYIRKLSIHLWYSYILLVSWIIIREKECLCKILLYVKLHSLNFQLALKYIDTFESNKILWKALRMLFWKKNYLFCCIILLLWRLWVYLTWSRKKHKFAL